MILAPPVAVLVVLAAVLIFSESLKPLAFKKSKKDPGALKPYACGENVTDHMVQPNYGQFLPFAVFFTILHVVALIVATAEAVTVGVGVLALIYIACAITGLFVLYRD